MKKTRLFDLKISNKNQQKSLINAFKKVLNHGQFFLGPEVREFEKKISSFLKSRYSIGVASGSSALYLSLRACGIGPGDEVITTPLSWIITSNAISSCGAVPIFVDVKDDLNINEKLIEKSITKKTKAIVPMHYGGHACNMKSIMKIARKNKLFVVEDAAQAFGSELYKNGIISDVVSFSMNPMKPLGGYGENGAIVTNNYYIYKKIKLLRHAGTLSDPQKKITNKCVQISLNHKMDTINASFLLDSLKNFKKKLKVKRILALKYYEKLNSYLKFQTNKNDIKNHALYAFTVISNKRDALKKFLEKNNIETKIYHEPLIPESPAYQHLKKCNIPNSKKLIKKILSLPIHEKINDKDILKIQKVIKKFKDI